MSASSVVDAQLAWLRLPFHVQQMLTENNVATCADLMESEKLLTDVRKHLNPIQHSKLNTLIKEYETNNPEYGAEVEVEVSNRNKIMNREKSNTTFAGANTNNLPDSKADKREESMKMSAETNESSTVFKPGPDFIAQQQRAYQWRMSMLHRLVEICDCTCKYNRNMDRLHSWNKRWTHDYLTLDLQMMSPCVHINKREYREMARAFDAEGRAIHNREIVFKREAACICELILEWNRESVRLNSMLIENPRLDQSSCLKSVVMFTLRGSMRVLCMQHSMVPLVQPGEAYGSFLQRVESAQRHSR